MPVDIEAYIKDFNAGMFHRNLASKYNISYRYSKNKASGLIKQGKLVSRNILKVETLEIPKVLLLDIETAPMLCHVWGLWDQNIQVKAIERDWFILCWAAKWLFDSKLMYDIVTPKESLERNDKRIVKSVWKLVNEADIIIGHNVQKFDMKKLNARWKFHDIQPPMPYQIIDTLTHSRANFGNPSHKQEYITKWLQLPEKLETEFQLWVDCIHGDKKALNYMVKYCRKDVTGLEEMYLGIRPWMKSHPNLNVYVDTDQAICPTCSNSNLKWKGFYYTPAGRYRAFRCIKCGAIGRSRFSELSKGKRKNTVISIAR